MNYYLNLSDDDLFSLLKTGDEDAFAAIYQKHWAIMYLYARKLVETISGAEEVVQDVLSQLWTKRAELENKSSATVYLYSLVRHTALIYIQKNGSEQHMNALADFIDQGKYNVNSSSRDKELIQNIERAVSSLPQKLKDLFKLSKEGRLDRNSMINPLKKSDNEDDKNIH